jgi:hypothetical protein
VLVVPVVAGAVGVDAAVAGAVALVEGATPGKSLPPAGNVWPVGKAARSIWSSRSNGATVGEASPSRAPGGRTALGGPRLWGAVTDSKSGGGAAASSIQPAGDKTFMPGI